MTAVPGHSADLDVGWHEVRPEGNPAPGDVVALRALGRKAGEASGEFDRAQSYVQRIASGAEFDGSWSGVAADAFMFRAKDFKPELERAGGSFSQLCTALYSWAAALDTLQERADTCLSAALAARRNLDDAEQDLWYAEREYDTADPPFDTSRAVFLEDYERNERYWRERLQSHLDESNDIAGDHREKASSSAQAVVAASKAGFRGDDFLEKAAKYSGYVGEELEDLGSSLVNYVVKAGELYLELKQLEAALWYSLLPGGPNPAEALDAYTAKLSETLDHLTPVIVIMSLVPFPPVQVAARALQGIKIGVDAYRYAAYRDGDPIKIGIDAVLFAAPMAARARATTHGRIASKAMDYRRVRPAFDAGPAFTKRHIEAMVKFNNAGSLIDDLGKLKDLYETGTTQLDINTPDFVSHRTCVSSSMNLQSLTMSIGNESRYVNR